MLIRFSTHSYILSPLPLFAETHVTPMYSVLPGEEESELLVLSKRLWLMQIHILKSYIHCQITSVSEWNIILNLHETLMVGEEFRWFPHSGVATLIRFLSAFLNAQPRKFMVIGLEHNHVHTIPHSPLGVTWILKTFFPLEVKAAFSTSYSSRDYRKILYIM